LLCEKVCREPDCVREDRRLSGRVGLNDLGDEVVAEHERLQLQSPIAEPDDPERRPERPLDT
jgi:hypothetical protein